MIVDQVMCYCTFQVWCKIPNLLISKQAYYIGAKYTVNTFWKIIWMTEHDAKVP